MIVSDNPRPSLAEFQSLMSETDRFLNYDAEQRQDYYVKRGGKLLEQDVCDAMNECAAGTAFQGTIQLVSGASFPDIVANRFYGVEVKSTEKDHWTSTGSSILESTRNQQVERIYLTFGKLGKPVQFLSRPYEECLSGIAVTHYPRYLIDMRLQKGETIFDKMGIAYDDLRIMDNPVAPVSKYYKSKLKSGERLWWADDAESAVPPTVKLWTALDSLEKNVLVAQGYALFPELFIPLSSKKYNRFALWLATEKGIVNTNVRDSFSAGGKVLMKTASGIEIMVPAVFGRTKEYHTLIEETLMSTPKETLAENWGVDEISEKRIKQWAMLVSTHANSGIGYQTAMDILRAIFPAYI